MPEEQVAPWTRVAILLTATTAAIGFAKYLTGSYIPTDPRYALIFQNALLLVVLGSAVLEHKFTKPADSVVSGLMGGITLVSVYGMTDPVCWWIVTGYCAAVFVTATACTVASTSKDVRGWKRKLADITYRPAVVFGRARVLFSIVFLALSLPGRLDLARRILNEAAAGGAGSEGRARSLLELEGLGADLWSGRDAQDYVDELRREWNGRP